MQLGCTSLLQNLPPTLRQACVSGIVHAQGGVPVLNDCFVGLCWLAPSQQSSGWMQVSWGSDKSEEGSSGELS
jgi:hypothetical protein